MASKNKTVIDSLISTQQGRDAKLYELLRKISEDLGVVYKAVFEGPLPTVNANALTNLNADNIEGGLQKDNLPSSVMYEDENNIATKGQIVSTSDAFGYAWRIAGGSTYGRLFIFSDNDYAIGVNLYWSGGAWQGDSGTFGAAIRFKNGTIEFWINIGGAVTKVATIDGSGVIEFGSPASILGSSPGESVIQRERYHRGASSGGTYRMIGLDADNKVALGKDAANTGDGHVSIPTKSIGNLPGAGGTKDGIIVIDDTNSRLCFYVNGARYYITGIAF